MNRLIVVMLISLLLFVCMLFGSFAYVWTKSYKLGSYLKKNNYKRWRELTTVGKFGPGGINPFRSIPYVYGEKDNEDETILRYKDAIRIGLRYSIAAFGAIIANVVIVAILIKRSSQ